MRAGRDSAAPPGFDERVARWIRNLPIRRGEETPADAARFVELFNATYPRKQAPSYYFWRFWAGPGEKAALFVDSEQALRGCCGSALMEMTGPANFCAGFIVDLMVDSKSRGAGLIFARLKDAVEEAAAQCGAKAIFMLPNASGTAAFLGDKRYVELCKIETCLAKAGPGRVLLDRTVEFRRIDRFGGWVEGLGVDFQDSHLELAFVKRTESYLNWRFATNPIHSYEIFQAIRGGNVFGYVVLKKFTDNRGASFGDIVDILWREDDANTLAQMLWFALEHLDSQGVPRAAMWLQTNTILDQVGREAGFTPTEQRRAVLCKVLDEEYGWLRDAKRWFLTMSDSEVY